MEATKSYTAQEQPHEVEETRSSETSACTFQNTEHAALAYAAAGLSVIPLNLDKSPALLTWKEFQSTIASPETIRGWYSYGKKGVGIVCGAVSRNIECLDIDEKYNLDSTPLLDQFSPLVDALASGLLSRLVHEESQNGGHHYVYRSSTVDGNSTLAKRLPTQKEKEDYVGNRKIELKSEGKSAEEIEAAKIDPPHSVTLIETRGEGGYFACYPTPGYPLISGTFMDIPEITDLERRILWDCARSLNKFTDEQKRVNGYPKKRRTSIVRPGDDFNDRGDIVPVLKEAGWKLLYTTKQKVQHWRRPGKKEGMSATFNKEPNMFYAFSSNCSPLEPNTWYTKFALLTMLSYGGDFAEAAKELAEQGYGATVVAEAETFLNQFFEFRFNVVTGRAEYREKGIGQFRVIQDYDLNSICRRLHLSHIPIGADTLARLLKSEYSKPFDPFRKYYESLPAWDQSTNCIAQLASTVQLKNPAEIPVFEDYLRKWLVGAVGCALDPNVTNHNCLTLVGPQGYYKTTWLNRLLPERLSPYLHVGTIEPTNKDTLIHLSECFLINLDELEILNKHELGSLKSVMTMKENRIRRPYGHFADQLIRRASFVGSINKDSFLTDETGPRRFLVFEIASIDPNHAVDMDNVHAQAYSLFKSGFRHWFDKDEITTVNERNRGFSIQTTEDELVVQYVTGSTPGVDVEWLTATQVAKEISERTSYLLGKSSARDFGFALKKAGYPSKKLDGITRYAVKVTRSLGFDSTSLHFPTSGKIKKDEPSGFDGSRTSQPGGSRFHAVACGVSSPFNSRRVLIKPMTKT